MQDSHISILAMDTRPKVQHNFYWPPAVSDAFNELASHVPPKQRSMIAVAAVVLLLEADETTRRDVIRRVQEASMYGGSFEELVAQALAKHEAASAPPTRGRVIPPKAAPTHPRPR